MGDTLIFQYIIIAVMLFGSIYSLYKVIKKTFSPNKFDSKRTHCDKDCGCS